MTLSQIGCRLIREHLTPGTPKKDLGDLGQPSQDRLLGWQVASVS